MKRKIDVTDILALIALAVLIAFSLTGCGMIPRQQTTQEISAAAEQMHLDAAFDRIEKEATTAINEKQNAQTPPDAQRANVEAGQNVFTNDEPQKNERATNAVETQIPVAAASAEPEENKSDFGDMVLEYRDWLFFLAYCAVSLLAAWYFKRTGQSSDTLKKITDTVGQRLTFKHRLLFRILRFVYRRKKVKKIQQGKEKEK